MSDSTFPVLGSEGRKSVSLLAFDALSVDQRERLLDRAFAHRDDWVRELGRNNVKALRSFRIHWIIRTWAAGRRVMCLGRIAGGDPIVRVEYYDHRGVLTGSGAIARVDW